MELPPLYYSSPPLASNGSLPSYSHLSAGPPSYHMVGNNQPGRTAPQQHFATAPTLQTPRQISYVPQQPQYGYYTDAFQSPIAYYTPGSPTIQWPQSQSIHPRLTHPQQMQPQHISIQGTAFGTPNYRPAPMTLQTIPENSTQHYHTTTTTPPMIQTQPLQYYAIAPLNQAVDGERVPKPRSGGWRSGRCEMIRFSGS